MLLRMSLAFEGSSESPKERLGTDEVSVWSEFYSNGVPHSGHISELIIPKKELHFLQSTFAATDLPSWFGIIFAPQLGHLGSPVPTSTVLLHIGQINPK